MNNNICLCGHTKNQHSAFGVCNHFIKCSCSKYTAAQQGVHPTAFHVFLFGVGVGGVLGIFSTLLIIGGG